MESYYTVGYRIQMSDDVNFFPEDEFREGELSLIGRRAECDDTRIEGSVENNIEEVSVGLDGRFLKFTFTTWGSYSAGLCWFDIIGHDQNGIVYKSVYSLQKKF